MRYLRLWVSFLKASWMADMEYRLNLVVRIFGEVVWYATQLSVFEVLYTHTDQINGWSIHGMRVFMASLFLVDNFYMILFHENLEYMWSLVRKGDLDLYLTKPVNAQFMVSFRKVSATYLINLVMVLGYLYWAVSRLEHSVSLLQVCVYMFLLLCGLGIYYSLRFLFACLLIILQDASNIQFLWYQLFRLAQRPDPIYPPVLRWLVLTAFPVGFLASVPARALVEGVNSGLLVAAMMLSLGLLFFSHWSWERALRKYSSASS